MLLNSEKEDACYLLGSFQVYRYQACKLFPIYSVLSEMKICTKWNIREYPENNNDEGEKQQWLHGRVGL